MSVGRQYDKIRKKADGEVKIVTDHGGLCKVRKN